MPQSQAAFFVVFQEVFAMSRLSWPCLVLCAVLITGCGIIQDKSASSQSGMTTPFKMTQTPAQQDAAARMAAAQREAAAKAQMQSQMMAPVQQQPVSATKVALLVPLSGKSAALGQAMVNAAQLAVFDMGVNQFELMPRDTKGTPEGAVAAAREAISSGAKLLIGPLFAADVAAVKPVVRESDVSMLALSTDVSLAETGSFVMGFAPAPQVERVVSYAITRGDRSFAALVPAGPYGQLVSKAFEQSVLAKGGTVVVTAPVANIDQVIAQKDKIDAIFLPFGGADLRKIAGQLSAAGFDAGRVHLLGTGLWDEPNLVQGETLLSGGWFAAPEPMARERFMQAYQEAYDQPAPRLSTLAYDATALATVLARKGAQFDNIALCLPSGFVGLDGIFRLLPSGQIQRGLAVLEVSQAGTKIVDPAPATFSGM